jgi:hypothetical protein
MIDRDFSNHRQFNLISRSSCLHRKLILNLAVFSILLGLASVLRAEEPKSALSAKKLKELASKIEAVENSISNIKIEAQSWLETRVNLSNPNKPWQQTPIYHSHTSWAQRGPEGKARVDVHKRVFKWMNGPAPYGEESYSMSFDGQHGRYIRRAVGPLGQTHPVKEGQILPEAPDSLEHGSFDTGTYWSLPFFSSEIYKFSEIFRLASNPNSEIASELEFTLEEFEGVECIKIKSVYDVTYWLDPSRGFALRGKKSIAKYEDGHEELVKFVKVTRLKEVADGIWWPMEVSSISRPYEAGKPWRRFVYHASNVVANDPNFNESVFTIIFPTGYTIDDKVAGRKYIVGQD